MKISDQSAMPFGKHKGEKMEDVPASYLLFLWNKGSMTSEVKEYIKENLQALQKEAPDVII